MAFLRGMNLGGRRIKNDELRLPFEALGFDDVATFRASGNVVFGVGKSDADELTTKIEATLAEELGYAVPVFLRSATELRKVAAREPFETDRLVASMGKPQIAFLPAAPKAPARKEALASASDDDLLALSGRELYWLPSGGISETDLDLKSLESILGPWTMRTKGTIDQIASKHFA